MNNLTIGFNESESFIAQEIKQTLEQVGIIVNLIPSNLPGGEFLFDRLNQSSSKSIILISTSFLKDVNSVYNAFDSSKELIEGGHLLPVVCPDLSIVDGKVEKSPTRIEKIGDMIKFMNYWQEKYLDIRKSLRKENLSVTENQLLAEELNIIRPISSEMGEILRLFKVHKATYLEDLRASSYGAIFNLLNNQYAQSQLKEGLESGKYKAILAEGMLLNRSDETIPSTKIEQKELVEELVDVSAIPGMNLLNGNLEQKENVQQTLHQNDPIESSTIDHHVEKEQSDSDYTDSKSTIHSDDSKHLSKIFEDDPVLEDEVSEDSLPIDQGLTANQDHAQEDELEEDEEFDADNLLKNFIDKENAKFEAEYLNKAIELFKSNDKDQAFKLIEEGVKKTQSGYAVIKWIDFLLEVNELDEAYAFALQALEEDCYNEQLVYKIGLLELDRGRTQEAIARFEKVLGLDPEFEEVYYALAVLLLEHVPNSETRSLKLLKRSIKFDNTNTDALYRYSLLLIESFNEFQKGKKILLKVLKRAPGHLFANYDLALYYHKKGDQEKALKYYIAAIENNEELQTPGNNEAFGYSSGESPESPYAMEKQETTKDNSTKEKGIVLITGATSGIGKATAYEFGSNGYNLILTGRRQDRLDEIRTDLERKFGIKTKVLCFDVRSFDAVKSNMDMLDDAWSQIDILINNAGLARGLAPIHEGNVEHWETMIDTNIKGLLYMSKLVSKQMVSRNSGHIINVCSTAGKETYPKGNVYCATKFAVDALTKSMRLDLYEYGIRVSQVSPAHVEETEFAKVRFDQDDEKAKIYNDFNPLKSSDVAETIYFIANRPAHVNIQDILIMGTQQAGSNFIDRSGRKF
ncbi:MAG: SDR family oxidoreductase [Saprospiraceae bacterium]|nr:SDR family oxidoreductase [Saprospiraceae bacterium]